MAVATAVVAMLNHFSQGLPDAGKLRYYEPSETTRIYSADGHLIATLFRENRTWTPIDEISPYLRKAVLAIEDSRFYQHRGVDPVGIARAAVYDITHKGAHQGASTITMQLARNLFLTPKQNMERKLKEMLLALQIEKKFSKDEILELYLNQIYFGGGAYGVQAAAKTYYNKSAKDLSPAQAALLAGLPQAPSEFSPLVDERAAKMRQILVLGRMVSLGYLSWDEYRQALEETQKPHFFAKKKEEFQVMEVPYFTEFAIRELYSRYDEDLLYRGGLKIFTTVDLKMQKAAEETVRRMVKANGKYLNADTAALVCIENKTGFIRAMCGGMGWSKKSQFNRAWQAHRLPGSSFKLFVYSAAIEAGYSPETVVPDTAITYRVSETETWSPKNSDRQYMGPIDIRTALQYSRNVVAVKLLTMVGAERVIELAHAMGVREQLEPHLSLALGSEEVSVLSMASAYSVIPNGGMKVEATPIKTILDSQGNVVEDNTYPRQTEVLTETTAYIMAEMLENVVNNGTGNAAILPGRRVAGKTGTTDEFRDAWFCGFTRQLTTAVWVGNDNNARMVRSFGGDLPAKIWNRFMLTAMKGLPSLAFGTTQDGKVGVVLCTDSRLRATNGCVSTYREFFPARGIPVGFCDMHNRGQAVAAAARRPGMPVIETGPAPDAIPMPGVTIPFEEEQQEALPPPSTPGWSEVDPGGGEALPAPPSEPLGPARPAPVAPPPTEPNPNRPPATGDSPSNEL